MRSHGTPFSVSSFFPATVFALSLARFGAKTRRSGRGGACGAPAVLVISSSIARPFFFFFLPVLVLRLLLLLCALAAATHYETQRFCLEEAPRSKCGGCTANDVSFAAVYLVGAAQSCTIGQTISINVNALWASDTAQERYQVSFL